MITPENSKMLAIKRQIAIYNLDFKMIQKIENIKKDSEITKEIKEYSIKK